MNIEDWCEVGARGRGRPRHTCGSPSAPLRINSGRCLAKIKAQSEESDWPFPLVVSMTDGTLRIGVRLGLAGEGAGATPVGVLRPRWRVGMTGVVVGGDRYFLVSTFVDGGVGFILLTWFESGVII